MTVAEKILEWIASLGNILTRANAKIAAKNGTAADTIFDLPDAIDTVPTGADVSGVTAGAAQVLSGYKIVDSDGNLIDGSMTNRGAVNKTLTSNTSYTIPAGYHNGSGKVTANVSQTVVTGEDSTNCTAVASDVRYGKSFRAGGIEDTGELRTVSVPKVVIDVDTTSSSSNVQVKAYTNASTTEGILPAGSSGSTVSKTIPKYTNSYTINSSSNNQTLYTAGKYMTSNLYIEGMEGYSGSYYVTPSSSEQRLDTAGKYLTSNVVVNAVDVEDFVDTYTGSYTVTPGSVAQTLNTAEKYLTSNIIVQSAQAALYAAVGVWSSKYSITISEITEMPQMFMLHVYSTSGFGVGIVSDVGFSIFSSGSSKAYEITAHTYDNIAVSSDSGFVYTKAWQRKYGAETYTSGTILKDSEDEFNVSLTSSGLTLTSRYKMFDGTYNISWM